jgi:hypothetical protein
MVLAAEMPYLLTSLEWPMTAKDLFFFSPFLGAPSDRNQKRSLAMICLLILVATVRMCTLAHARNEPASTNYCSCISVFTHPNVRRMLLSRGKFIDWARNWRRPTRETVWCLVCSFQGSDVSVLRLSVDLYKMAQNLSYIRNSNRQIQMKMQLKWTRKSVEFYIFGRLRAGRLRNLGLIPCRGKILWCIDPLLSGDFVNSDRC